MDLKKTPLAITVFVEIVYLFCALSVVLVPDFAKSFYGSWFHGLDLNKIWDPNLVTFGSFIYGMVTSFVGAYIATWAFVRIYKAIASK